MLNEIEASKLSDIEFKIRMLNFIRMLKELSENYRELQGSYKELIYWELYQHEKGHRNCQ